MNYNYIIHVFQRIMYLFLVAKLKPKCADGGYTQSANAILGLKTADY
jgi:hypothetical protein